MIEDWGKPVIAAKPKQPIGRLRRIAEAVYRVRRRIATGFAVVLAVFFAYHVVFGRNGVNSFEQKRIQDRQLHQQIDALQQENDRLKDHVGRLKNDPDAIEYEAREKLHYARRGEVIYTLNKPPVTEKAPASTTPSSNGSN
jgi:cell division protein FtsB